MRFLLILFAFLTHQTAGLGQKQDITIFEKKDGNKNIVMARNTGKVAYLVTLQIDATGMDVTPGMKAEGVVPAGYMKEMATITPRPGESWSYGYEVSFTEHTAQEIHQETASPKETSTASIPAPTAKPTSQDNSIIVYTQAGCGRCSTVKRELTNRGISFKEVDVNSGKPEVNDMWKELQDTGFSGNSVTMPVVKADGKLHYNIKDLMGFVNGLEN